MKHFDQLLGGYETIFKMLGGYETKSEGKIQIYSSIIYKDHINI